MNYDVVGRMKFKDKGSFFAGLYNLIKSEIYFDANPVKLTVEVNPCEEFMLLNHETEHDFYSSIKSLMDLNLHFEANPNCLQISLTGGL
jgi:hypothetical protein